MVNGYVPRTTLPTAAIAIRHMTEEGIPAEEHAQILDTIEAFVVGSALMYEHTRNGDKTAPKTANKKITPADDDVFLAMTTLLTKGLTEHFSVSGASPNGKGSRRPRAVKG
jgi:hypothetical protein